MVKTAMYVAKAATAAAATATKAAAQTGKLDEMKPKTRSPLLVAIT